MLLTLTAGFTLCSMFISTHAFAGTPAEEALSVHRGDAPRKDAIQNRFFLKEGRFEVAPIGGYVPNNPMVRRYIGGLIIGYHFSEQLSASAQLLYSPDLGESDLKGLTNTLVIIAHGGASDVEFQQPVDKMVLGAVFNVMWAPIYGKINLVGEAVLNFDLYGTLGLGMITVRKHYARYDSSAVVNEGDAPVSLTDPSAAEVRVRVPLSIGMGTNFFLTQMLAIKLDARSLFYVDSVPQYDPNNPVDGSRIYNNFLATAGVSIFFPRMEPRVTQF
jgi:outer membrane beta-barrel protein